MNFTASTCARSTRTTASRFCCRKSFRTTTTYQGCFGATSTVLTMTFVSPPSRYWVVNGSTVIAPCTWRLMTTGPLFSSPM